MANITNTYATAASVTITVDSLASDASLLAGRQSASIDFTAANYQRVQFGGTIVTGSSATAGSTINVWLVWRKPDGTWPDGFSTSDANRSVYSQDQLSSYGIPLASMIVTATASRAYSFNAIVDALPAVAAIFAVHNTGAALAASGNSIGYQGQISGY